MFNNVMNFVQGLTNEEVYGNTHKITNEEVSYKEAMYERIKEVMQETDKDFNYRLNKMRLSIDNEVELTSFVKGGRL